MILQLLYSFTLLYIVVLGCIVLCAVTIPLAKMSDQICHSFMPNDIGMWEGDDGVWWVCYETQWPWVDNGF